MNVGQSSKSIVEFKKVHEELSVKASANQMEHVIELLDVDASMRMTDEAERSALSLQVDRIEAVQVARQRLSAILNLWITQHKP